MYNLLDPQEVDLESAAARIHQSESNGQLLPLFFEALWRKQGRTKSNKPLEHVLDPEAVRVADAVVIQRGRPIQWYFSSVREQGVLLCKSRKNVTADAIVDHFLQKKHLSVSGVCAQFIEPCETSRQGVQSTFILADKLKVWLSTLSSTRSGILQRFVDPALSPGSTNNWEISCMWTPSALDAERVESSKELSCCGNSNSNSNLKKNPSPPLVDPALRCDVYRPEVTVVKRLVCSRHMAMVDECCRAIGTHFEQITGGKSHVTALELQCKVNAQDHLIVLYPRRMAFTSNDGSKSLELQLPCILPVTLPFERQLQIEREEQQKLLLEMKKKEKNQKEVDPPLAFLAGASPTAVAAGSSASFINSSFASSATSGSYQQNLLLTSASRQRFQQQQNQLILLQECLVCKAPPPPSYASTPSPASSSSSKVQKQQQKVVQNISIPLKHVLVGLEALLSARQKQQQQQRGGRSSKTTPSEQQEGEVPLHVSMLFPEISFEEYSARKNKWGEDKVVICQDCSNGLKDAVSLM